MNQPELPIQKIVSGGQTGVDRAALDVAIFLEISHGGWCPRGRLAEDGAIPDVYQLRETVTEEYSTRTRQNVIDSDGTLIIYEGKMSGGTAYTLSFARKMKRPVLAIRLEDRIAKIGDVKTWLRENNVQVLNVAGPRESSRPGIGKNAGRLLLAILDGQQSSAPEFSS